MEKQVGIWIDHRSAYVVFVGEGEDRTERIESGMEKHSGPSGRSSEESSADDRRERQFSAHLDLYYDEVISHVREAESILLLGPGEAKGELEKRLTDKGLAKQIVGVETFDKMTDNQIAAIVRQHYQK